MGWWWNRHDCASSWINLPEYLTQLPKSWDFMSQVSLWTQCRHLYFLYWVCLWAATIKWAWNHQWCINRLSAHRLQLIKTCWLTELVWKSSRRCRSSKSGHLSHPIPLTAWIDCPISSSVWACYDILFDVRRPHAHGKCKYSLIVRIPHLEVATHITRTYRIVKQSKPWLITVLMQCSLQPWQWGSRRH